MCEIETVVVVRILSEINLAFCPLNEPILIQALSSMRAFSLAHQWGSILWKNLALVVIQFLGKNFAP